MTDLWLSLAHHLLVFTMAGVIAAEAAMLRPGMTPVEETAVSENVKAALGKPVLAYPDQDHVAHLKTHLNL